MNVHGCWQEIMLDDFFPCNFWNGKIMFDSTSDCEIWALLLEKVYAKMHGGYANIAWGLGRYSFVDLTGAPSLFWGLNPKSPEQEITKHWNNLHKSDQRNYAIVALTGNLSGDGKDGISAGSGMVSNHYYTVVKCVDLDFTGGNFKLLKVRNPWGNGEWKGKWSDNDPVWKNPEVKTIIPHEKEDNGAFWMDFEDFKKYFKGYNVCYLKKGYSDANYKLELQESKPYVFKFDVKSTATRWFGLHQ
jgi:hypothetical protein